MEKGGGWWAVGESGNSMQGIRIGTCYELSCRDIDYEEGLQTGGSWKGLKEEMRQGLICEHSLGMLSPGQEGSTDGF